MSRRSASFESNRSSEHNSARHDFAKELPLLKVTRPCGCSDTPLIVFREYISRVSISIFVGSTFSKEYLFERTPFLGSTVFCFVF